MPQNFIIYRSSAGSGKTYTLTKEYLKLAFRHDNYYKHILAVTFTNKAMQEMKTRIINKLSGFSHGEIDAMGEEIMQYAKLDAATFQKTSRQLLTELLHGYSNFSVSTIDSFFQKVIRSFAKELGLAGTYRLELDHELLLIQVVDELLLEATKNKQLREWLIDFAKDNLFEGGNWDVRTNIRGLAKELFQENFKAIEKDILSQGPGITKKLKAAVSYITNEFETYMDALGSSGTDLMNKHNVSFEDFSYGRSGAVFYLEKIKKDIKKYEIPKRLADAFEKANWYTKKSSSKTILDTLLADGLENILRDAVSYYEQHAEAYHTAIHVRKFIYQYGLLADLTQKLNEYKSENDIMLISDATSFLKELVQDADAPFVYEKVGSFYNHYLIDEFQDTSGFQWDSFRPLVEESLAQGYKNLVVGDVKQSIYRWRGGDWELLLEKIEEDVGRTRTHRVDLDTNYRSEGRIINFNNQVFDLLPKIMQAEGSEQAAWQDIIKVYQGAAQKVPLHKQSEEKGFVKIKFLQDDEESKWKGKVTDELPVLIENLQDKGFALKDIAVLVRRNDDGKEVVNCLSAYQGSGNAKPGYRYDVVSNESLFLSASPAIQLILSALSFLQDKNNKVTQGEMVYFYQKLFYPGADQADIFHAVNEDKFALLPDELENKMSSILYLPFYELVENLIDIFKINELIDQFAYLQTFQDIVLKFSQNEKSDISSFLEWWEERGVKESIKVADDLDAIRILTIHKAKGLEFPAVIIPYCDWPVDHGNIKPVLWCETDKEPYRNLHLPLKYKSDMEKTYFQEYYETEKMKAHLDSLNMLYVAFTRAAHSLHVFAPEGKNKGIAKVLSSTLNNQDFSLKDSFDIKKASFEYGDADVPYKKKVGNKEVPLTLTSYNHFSWRNKITVKQRADDFVEDTEKRKKINYGILMHKLLAKVKYMGDADRSLKELFFEEGLNAEQEEQLRTLIHDLLSNKEAKQWYTPEYRVMNEASILTSNEEYRPDRVIVKGKEAIIIDYKTGLPKKTDHQQLKVYIQLMNEMGYRPAKAYLWYLANNEVVEVH